MIGVCTHKASTELRSLTKQNKKKDNPAWHLLAGVLLAVPAPLDCRRQAFTAQNIAPRFSVFAVPFAAVRYAGLPLGALHHVGAAAKHTFAWTAAVFAAETLACRVGGAARHGARLLSTAVFLAVFGPRCPIRRTPFKLTYSTGTMLVANTTCGSN